MGLPLNVLYSANRALYSDSSSFLKIEDALEENLLKINMWIEILNNERQSIKLEILKEGTARRYRIGHLLIDYNKYKD